MSPQETIIYNYIKQNPTCSTLEITTFLGANYSAVRSMIASLKANGFIKKEQKGKQAIYFAVEKRIK